MSFWGERGRKVCFVKDGRDSSGSGPRGCIRGRERGYSAVEGFVGEGGGRGGGMLVARRRYSVGERLG